METNKVVQMEQEEEAERDRFNQMLTSFFQQYQTKNPTICRHIPVLISNGRTVDLYELNSRVRMLGGYEGVTSRGMWGSVAESMGFEEANGVCMKLVFCKYLDLMDKWVIRCGGTLATTNCFVPMLTWLKKSATFQYPDEKVHDQWAHQCFQKVLLLKRAIYEPSSQQEQDQEGIHSQKKRKVDFNDPKSHPIFTKSGREVQFTIKASQSANGSVTQKKSRSKAFLHSKKNRMADRLEPRIGADFQAEIPSCDNSNVQQKEIVNQLYNMSGYVVWPLKNCQTVGSRNQIINTDDSCKCLEKMSIDCVRLHIREERERLKEDLGVLFSIWRFNDMGESASQSWCLNEEQKFWAVVTLNSKSEDKSIWNSLLKCFCSKKPEELVNYYFNVFMLRQRQMQNRYTPNDIDSDDDEPSEALVRAELCKLNKQNH